MRATLYNRTRLGQGFWNCLTLHPSFDETGGLRYYVSVQMALTPDTHKRVVTLQRRTAVQVAGAGAAAYPAYPLSPISLAITSPAQLRPMPQLSTPSSTGASSSGANSRPSNVPPSKSRRASDLPAATDSAAAPVAGSDAPPLNQAAKGSSACAIL